MRLSAALLSLMILGLSAASAEVGSEKPTEEEALILAVPADLALQDSTLISQAGSRRKPLGKAEEKAKDEPKPPQSEEPVVEEQKEAPVVPEAPDRSRRSLLPTPRRDRAPDESQERIDLTTPSEKEKMLQEEGPA
ncbi:MAG: hypothetical protein KC994_15045, partial [Candidatus Omnitrophica bacterium]|nr:hypothetical protein [Candidatus Omnitrophota bacterium]